jgi:hypothetical protein
MTPIPLANGRGAAETSSSSDEREAPIAAHMSRGDSLSGHDDDDAAFAEEGAVERCGASSASCDEGSSAARRTRNVSPPRPSDTTEDETLREAVAASTALMGETVMDSPNQNYSKPQVRADAFGGKSPPAPPPLTTENASAMSVGIMAQGLAWARRQREQRRRLYLQNQAEQQLRKIREAQAEEQHAAKGRSLMENPTFQNLKGWMTTKRSSSTERERSASFEEFEEDGVTKKISKSGDGVTVELDVASEREEEDAAFIPPVRIEEERDHVEQSPFILNENQRQQIAFKVLPRGIVYCRWKRLYSLARDGDSFETCLNLIKEEKHTLLVVRTARNAIFGGYADSPWEPHTSGGACYYGGSGAVLFRVDVSGRGEQKKSTVKRYKWTGANRYVQLCDPSHKMLAFGGGGEDGAFGLCVEQDFQVGSTGSCATFDNEPLTDQQTFDIVDLEIFGFLVGQF